MGRMQDETPAFDYWNGAGRRSFGLLNRWKSMKDSFMDGSRGGKPLAIRVDDPEIGAVRGGREELLCQEVGLLRIKGCGGDRFGKSQKRLTNLTDAGLLLAGGELSDILSPLRQISKGLAAILQGGIKNQDKQRGASHQKETH